MAEKYSLKDDLFNAETLAYLSDLFSDSDPKFDGTGFQRTVMAQMLSLELKERINLIAEVLADYLPADFEQAAQVIHSALPPPLDPSLTDDDFGRFIFAPLGEFVVQNGLEDHRDTALSLLEAITQRFSMEYAIRPFLNRWPTETLSAMQRWVGHDHYHVRRLVSEGTRPKLPWGIKVTIEPEMPMPFLDDLHADQTRFVTRSVANHLNDIAKFDPDLVVQTLKRWRREGRQKPEEMEWIIRHALRTLVKQGDCAALALLGFRDNPAIKIDALSIDQTAVQMNTAVTLNFRISAERDEALMVDYIVHFARPNGKPAQKVYKLKQVTMKAGQTLNLSKRHMLKGGASTFTLHPGAHRISVQVNGANMGEVGFDLLAAE